MKVKAVIQKLQELDPEGEFDFYVADNENNLSGVRDHYFESDCVEKEDYEKKEGEPNGVILYIL